MKLGTLFLAPGLRGLGHLTSSSAFSFAAALPLKEPFRGTLIVPLTISIRVLQKGSEWLGLGASGSRVEARL